MQFADLCVTGLIGMQINLLDSGTFLFISDHCHVIENVGRFFWATCSNPAFHILFPPSICSTSLPPHLTNVSTVARRRPPRLARP
jgi:hypothetical protein